MKWLLGMTLVGGTAVLSGCSRDFNIDPIFDFEGQSPRPETFRPGGPWEELRLKINPYTYNPSGEKQSLYARASNSGETEEKRKEARNALMEALILASDHNAGIHLASIKATNSSLNVGLGTAAIGLTAGATLAAEATSKALAASSTGLQGTRSLINEEVYAQAFAESIITLIEAERAKRAAAIREHYNDSLVEFPVERGLAEVMAYHQTASMYFGLSLAREAIERETIRRREDRPDPAASTASLLRATEMDHARALRSRQELAKRVEEITAKIESLAKRKEELAAAKGKLATEPDPDPAAQKAKVEATEAAIATNAEAIGAANLDKAMYEARLKNAEETEKSLKATLAKLLEDESKALAERSTSLKPKPTEAGK